MTGTLIIAGLCTLGAGFLLDLGLGTARRWVRPVPYLLAAVGSAALFAAGVRAVASHPGRVSLGGYLGFGTTSLSADSLSGLFLSLTSGVAVAVSLAFASWARPGGRVRFRGLGAAYNLTVGAVAAILLADNAFLFLLAWEALTLGFYMLASFERFKRDRARAGYLTLGVGKVGGALLLVGFLLLAARSGSFTLADWGPVSAGALRSVAYVFIVAGFSVKVGVIPFQVWMPLGYPAAPGPARAAMSGIAMNVGLYGLWRFLAILGAPPKWLVIAVLLLGSSTALLGIAHAAVQSRLDRVVAYSSVENGGILLTAYGIAMAGAMLHRPSLVAVGLLAATLHAIAHAVAKSGLFVAAGAVEAAVGTSDLERLRGVGRSMPWAGAGFAAGALTLAGLPPTIGFVSEWFILEALMQQFRLPGLALRLAMAAAGALIALTAGLAAITFLRVLGLTFLGQGDHPRLGAAAGGLLGKVAMGVLGATCLALAAVTPLEIRFIARGISSIVPAHVTGQALASPFVLQPVYPGFSILSPSWLWVAMPVLFGASLVGALVLSRGRILRIRRVPPWRSAGGGVTGEDRYSAFGYANPIRHVLSNLLQTRRQVRVLEEHPEGAHVEFSSEVVEPVEHYLYRPLRGASLRVVRVAKRLQSGRLDAYIAYVLFALLAVLAVVSALK